MTTYRDSLIQAIDEARHSPEYRNYLEVRDAVLSALGGRDGPVGNASAYWDEELQGFEYLFDASPLIVQKLRHHCYHITGVHEYDYRNHHAHKAGLIARKLGLLREKDREGLFVPESPTLGGFGYHIDGQLVNVDTLKFYESLIALSHAGLVGGMGSVAQASRLCGPSTGGTPVPPRKVVLEIGAGWGGFAYQFRTLFPNVTYLIVDLPATLLFSATYLKTVFPQAKMLLCDSGQTLADDLTRYDFVCIPHTYWDPTAVGPIDLAINMVSFQEMTTDQVEGYVRGLAAAGCPHVYSHNRERSLHNDELTSVGTLLRRHYDLSEIDILPVPYTNLTPIEPPSLRGLVVNGFKRLLGRPTSRRSPHDYKHLVATLKSARPKAVRSGTAFVGSAMGQ